MYLKYPEIKQMSTLSLIILSHYTVNNPVRQSLKLRLDWLH